MTIGWIYTRTALALCLLGSLTLAPRPAFAQAPGTAVPGATLTGHVICGDTNAPARFAKVMLKSATPTGPGNDIFGALSTLGEAGGAARAGGKDKPKQTPEEQAEQKAQLAAASKMFAGLSDLMVAATIGADGSYTFTNVKPGTYYIHATVPGYIDPFSAFSADDLASKDPGMKKRIAAALTTVTVDGTGSVRADLRLERGASITGRVLYDDGTPAVGWIVKPIYRTAAASENPFAALGVDASDLDLQHLKEAAVTDDTGRFHIAGLTSGDYTLQARLATGVLGTDAGNPMGGGFGALAGGGGAGAMLGNMMGLRLTVYSGNALRLDDAKPVHVGPAEERTGIEITMPLHVLHSISGRVTAKNDGHPVNAGSVELTGTDAAGKPDPSVHLTANLHPDGTFRFDYVPGPGAFILKATHARDMQPAPPKPKPAGPGARSDNDDGTAGLEALLGSAAQKPAHTYGSATTTVQLSGGDVDNVSLAVPEATDTPAP